MQVMLRIVLGGEGIADLVQRGTHFVQAPDFEANADANEHPSQRSRQEAPARGQRNPAAVHHAAYARMIDFFTRAHHRVFETF